MTTEVSRRSVLKGIVATAVAAAIAPHVVPALLERVAPAAPPVAEFLLPTVRKAYAFIPVSHEVMADYFDESQPVNAFEPRFELRSEIKLLVDDAADELGRENGTRFRMTELERVPDLFDLGLDDQHVRLGQALFRATLQEVAS